MKISGIKKLYFNRLFARLMLFTTLITMASVFLSSLLPYSFLRSSIRADTIQFNNQRLTNVKNVVDNTVYASMLKAMSDLLQDKQISTAVSGAEQISLSGAAAIHELLRKKTTQYTLDDISVYYENSRLILSATHGIKYLNDTAVELPYDFLWIQEIHRLSPGSRASIWLEPRALPDSLSVLAKRFSYVNAVRQSNGRETMYICVSMSDNVLNGVLSQIQLDQSAGLFIITDNGFPVAGTSDQFIPDDYLPYFPQLSNNAEGLNVPCSASTDGEIVTLLRSQYNGWYFMMIMPESVYYAYNTGFGQTVLIVCICILLAMLIINLFFTISVSSPIGRLAARIRQAAYPLEDKHDFWGNIEDVFTGLLEEADTHEHLISSSSEIVRRSFFGYLLQGQNFSDTALLSYMDFLKLKQNEINYLVCSLHVKDGVESCDAVFELIRSKIDIYTGIKCGEGLWALIFNGDIGEADAQLSFIEVIGGCAGYGGVYAGIGGVVNDLSDIRKTYLESLDALRYAAYFPEKHAFIYRETAAWEHNRQIDRRYEKRFVSALREYRAEEAHECLEEIYHAILHGPIAYPVYIETTERLVSAIEAMADEKDADLGELYNKTLSEQLSEHFYLRDVFDFIKNTASEVLTYINGAAAPVSVQYASKAIEYIEKNYHTDISIQNIADHLGISRFHLCRVFKQTQKKTLVDYISDLRINKAKRLLEETDLKIRDIASVSGFSNITYFNKKMKQHFGLTPSQIRKKEV